MRIETNRSNKHKMIELKARVDDHNVLRKKISEIGAEFLGKFHQKDQYFMVPEGRLKLRTIDDKDMIELIYYERENISGPKMDNAYILRAKNAQDLEHILKKILKPRIVIEKIREIYNYGGTQIHLDSVKKLGNFIEFERQTNDEPAEKKTNQLKIKKLIEKLEIPNSNLEAYSYSDILEKQNSKQK